MPIICCAQASATRLVSMSVIVHCRHREDDGIERPLRLLVDVKSHLMDSLFLEFRGDSLRRDLRQTDTEDTYLGCRSKGR